MAKAKRFYQKEYSKHIGATALLVASILALIFMTCGVPLGVLMVRERLTDSRPCNTLWGYKENCWNAAYAWRVEEDTCPDRRVRWETAEAFSIIALFSLLFNIGCSWYQLSNYDLKTATIFVAIFSVGSTTVPWAIVTAFYNTHYCGDYTFTHFNRRYGAGYALMVTSFCIQCVGLLLFIFLEPNRQSKRAVEEEKLLKEKKGSSISSSSSPSSSQMTSSHHTESHHSDEEADPEENKSDERL